MTQRNPKQCKRWVIKIGSALVTDDGRGLNHSAIQSWAEQFATLCSQGYELILVTSGAVAEGMARLKLKTRPHTLHELQAAAAVGQMGLIRAYEQKLLEHSIHCAQVLLTHEDLRDRSGLIVETDAEREDATLVGVCFGGVVPDGDLGGVAAGCEPVGQEEDHRERAVGHRRRLDPILRP